MSATDSNASRPACTPDERIDDLYARRLKERQSLVEKRTRIDRRMGDARLGLFTVAALVALFGLTDPVSGWWAVPFGLSFVAIVLAHEPARRRLNLARRAVEFYERGLARLEDRWHGTGVSGSEFLDDEHPYAADLDLFGEGSLYERLCQTRSRAGEAKLAAWLMDPADPAAVRARQKAVRELRPCIDLREELELVGSSERSAVDPVELAAWGSAPRVFAGANVGTIATLLALANIGGAVLWATTTLSFLPLLVTATLSLVFARSQRARVSRALSGLDPHTRELVLLAGLLERIERERFDAAMLRSIRDRLETGGRPASARINRLARLLHLLDTGRNQFFAAFAALLVWRTHIATLVDAWRAENGPAIHDWIAATAEFEALCSIAAYAAENPGDSVPDIVETGARFDADDIGHPLIPAAACVRNNIRLGDPARVLVVSGSNMSGKSTLLRTVGCNAVLAFAGAPVRAARLALSPLAPGATLRIQDSLREGRSRFYAEITRVRHVLRLTESATPVLFLFDEIFHGTNSSDRRIGAEAVLGSLIRSGAIGLATTHDLALAEIADNLGPAAENVHFSDTLVDGELHFDYRMRPGVVVHSNALALMRSVGLEV